MLTELQTKNQNGQPI